MRNSIMLLSIVLIFQFSTACTSRETVSTVRPQASMTMFGNQPVDGSFNPTATMTTTAHLTPIQKTKEAPADPLVVTPELSATATLTPTLTSTTQPTTTGLSLQSKQTTVTPTMSLMQLFPTATRFNFRGPVINRRDKCG